MPNFAPHGWPGHDGEVCCEHAASVRSAVLPEGWRGRVVPWSNHSTGRALAAFLEPHDCVVSKLVAYREKDFAFAGAMLESGLIDPTILARRIDRLPASLDAQVQKRLHSWLKAWVERHRPD